ncbi:MAG: PilX N-terminal domain-containing pilus assembly protein [Gammaproteobacteria bacterium]
MALATALILLVALTVIGTTAATVAIMETRLSGNYKQAVGGDLLIRQAARVAALEFADATTASQVLSATSPFSAAWTTTVSLSVPTTTSGSPLSVEAVYTPVQEYHLRLRDIYDRSDLFYDGDGTHLAATSVTSAALGSLVYYGFPPESSVSTTTKFFTEATPGSTAGFPALMVNVANPNNSAYRGRSSMLIRSPGPPIIAVAVTAGEADVGAHALFDARTGGTETGPPDADESCGSMSFERSLWYTTENFNVNRKLDGSTYQGSLPAGYSEQVDGAIALYQGLADYTLSSDGNSMGTESAPVVVNANGYHIRQNSIVHGIVASDSDINLEGPNTEIHGLVISSGEVWVKNGVEVYGAIISLTDLKINANSTVVWDSCALQNALSKIPPFIWNQ